MPDFITIIKVVSDVFVNPWVALATVFTFAIGVILLTFKPAISFRLLQWQKRRNIAKNFWVPELVRQLDRYVAYCVKVTHDDGSITCAFNEEGEPYDAKEVNVDEPPPAIYPTIINWTVIDSKIQYRVHSLSDESEKIVALFHFSSVESKSPDCEKYFEKRQLAYAQLGLEAYDIAKKVRRIYNIPRQSILNGERPEIALKRKVRQIKRRRRQKIIKLQLGKFLFRVDVDRKKD